MAIERAREEIREFFGRPAGQVASGFSRSWVNHDNRKDAFPGEQKVLALQTDRGIRYFTVEEVVAYTDAYTRERWPGSRGSVSRALTIAAMDPGEAIGYRSQGGHVLTFLKTQHEVDVPSAENIMLAGLQEIDRFGTPLQEEGSYLTSAGPAKLLGLTQGTHAQMTPFNFREQRAFLLSVGDRNWTQEELMELEADILAGIE